MTMRERARRGAAAKKARAAQRAERLRPFLDAGDHMKLAAFKADLPIRTANRLRKDYLGYPPQPRPMGEVG